MSEGATRCPPGTPMAAFPVSYQRPGASKLVGCLVYLVVAPFVALLLTIFASLPLLIGGDAFGFSKDLVAVVFYLLLLAIGAGVAVRGYREYRRRSALEVVVDLHALWTIVESRETLVRFEDVAWIRLSPTGSDFACVLGLRTGDVVHLPPEVAPFSLVSQDLETTLIPEMVRRLDETLARGEAVSMHVPRPQLLAPTLRALGTMLVSPWLLLSPWRFPLGIRLLAHAALVLRHAWLGLRGGFELHRDGLRRTADSAVVPWNRLVRIRSDPLGLVLGSNDGQVFALSLLAVNFWPVLRWLNARLK